jgi:outer membrane protein OmpA-like peptidoglycan-associated protein
MARWIAKFVIIVVILLAGTATAGPLEQKLGFRLKAIVAGNAKPKVIIKPQQSVKLFKATLFRSDGQTVRLKAANVAAGSERVLEVPQPKGKFDYKAKFEVTWADGKKETLRIRVAMTRAAELAIKLEPKDVDLDGRKVSFTLTADAKRAELHLHGAGGKTLDVVKQDLGGAKAGTAFSISWKDPGEPVEYLQLRAYDTTGFWKQMKLEPVMVSIPHRDIEFDFGKAKIRPREEPKLEETLSKLREALDKYGSAIPMRLYVGGYSDTVGNKGYNKQLSAKRARSIARWFRRKGIRIPIYYQGFGEDGLAVKTPDETPEPANRRAAYILSTHTPRKSDKIPRSNWKPL